MVASVPLPAPDVIGAWFSSQLDEARCRVEEIPLADSAEWRLDDGVIVHRSRGFFRVVGLECGAHAAAVFIDQLIEICVAVKASTFLRRLALRDDEAGDADYWLTPGDIRELLDEPGWLTNEARSALSLLLPWL